MTEGDVFQALIYVLAFLPTFSYIILRIRVTTPPPPRPVTPAVREEIDQTPGWWDKQFHKLLADTGQHYLEYGEIEYIEESTFAHGSTVYAMPRPRAYTSCTCTNCNSTRMMGCDPRD